MTYRFCQKHEAAQILGVSIPTLKSWRLNGKLIEGVHWFREGERLVLYNLTLIQDWFANRHNPGAHQRAIANFLESLPSSQSAKKRKSAA